jgi:hypothetical protein
MNARGFAVALTWAVVLTGCVSFEFPPTVGRLGCDPALAGSWRQAPSAGSDAAADERGASEWIVSRDCTIDLSKVDDADEDSMFDMSSFRTFDVGGRHYIAFEAYSALRNYDKNERFLGEWPQHRVLVLRYDLEGDALRLWAPDAETVSQTRTPGVRLEALGDKFRNDATGDNEFSVAIGTRFHFSGAPGDLEKLLREHGDRLYPQPTISLRRNSGTISS